jgi:LAS superfamily LD-carboxypeptidase LdcB
LPDDQLEKIEEGSKHRMRKEAASACRELLAAARAALSTAQREGKSGAAATTSIGVQSAYRNIREDTAAWEQTFDDYHNQMALEENFAGQELGHAALEYMVHQMILFKAPPGYSNHSNGLAVDFNTVQGKTKYAAKKTQNAKWKKTWFHQWLVSKEDGSSATNASTFGFKPLDTEAWHWDYDASLRKRTPT